MLHTIHADFYRLFRSKGFWISEIILALRKQVKKNILDILIVFNL
ncbi:hypothetical protein Si141_01794 [Streptococcus infantarius subsp. infantarius]|nr:hypothetical protein [Streptococcus infantarius subsp. infantarius]